MPVINCQIRSIDRLEGQYKILYPLLRVFSAYTQTWAALAMVFIVCGVIGVAVAISVQKANAISLEMIAYVLVLSPIAIVAGLSLLDTTVGRVGSLSGAFYLVLAVVFLLNLPVNIFVLWDLLRSVKDMQVPPFSPLYQNFLYASIPISILIVTLFNIYVIQLLLRAAIMVFRVRRMNRLILSTPRLGATWLGRVWYHLHSVPPVFEFVSKRKVLPLIMLSGLSGLCLGYATLVLAIWPTVLARSFDIANGHCLASGITADLIWLSERCSMTLIAGIGVFPLTLPPIFLFLGARLERRVRKRVRLSLVDLQRIDPRPPILFLRAFGDDQFPCRRRPQLGLGGQ